MEIILGAVEGIAREYSARNDSSGDSHEDLQVGRSPEILQNCPGDKE